ncbi:hypothetical protein RHSIM_RhsimUnG0234000 [Rhododendron simsii]|uniref:Uncharacterized protein n=1 Tax=Rhododendron simsii TaxID=118357 RepID=A0A834FYD8_RHOSS|nr:hypothetical protein RHSIM_RhsimUnG0234000 [Rhododendron simsii]
MKHEWIIEWGDLVDEWLEKEAEELHAQNQPELGNEIMGALQINDDWLMAYVDHTDHDNEEEWEWIPTPNEWQMLEETDPLDCVTLPLLFTNYEYELTYDQTSQQLFGQPPENLEDFFGNVQFYERCVEIAWNVEPTEYQLIEKNDPLDTFSLSHLFGHETRLSLNEINRQHQAMNVFGKEYNSDPSKFIVPDTEPKPVVYVPEVPEVLFLGSFEMENRRLMEAWAERETMGGELTVGDETWSDFVQNWESFQANPLDRYSLYGLFQESELVEEEERMDEELHSFVPPMTFDESSRGHFEDAHHTGHEEYAAFDTNQFIQAPEGYEQKDGMEDMCPLDGVTLPLLWKADPSQPAVETVFEDNDCAIDGLSERLKAVDINKRKAKESLEDIWMEDPDMKQKMEEIKKGKRKVDEDVWGNNQGLWDETVSRLTRSGRVVQRVRFKMELLS